VSFLTREIWLPFIVLIILGIGLLSVSSVAPSPDVLQKQFIGAGMMLPVFGLMFWVGRPRLYAVAFPLYGIALALLVITMVAGTEVNGNRNWLGRGFFQFQPLEFAKIALILMLARALRKPFKSWREYGPLALIALPMLGLVYVGTGDFGGMLVLAFTVFGMMLVRGIPWQHLLAGVLVLAIFVPTVLVPRLAPYQRDRLTTFINPAKDPRGKGYQQLQAMIATGSGGLTGKGYQKGSQSQGGFIPEAHNDMIFAVWAEEQGFLGATLLILAYAFLFWRMSTMGFECPSDTDRLVIGGVMAMLGFQVLENLGAALSVAPLTGLTLPLVSSGVSSLLAVSAALSVVYVVHRDRFNEFG
jgi:rod shape determining protein RodA